MEMRVERRRRRKCSVDETPMRSGGACVGGSPAAPRPSERLISRISGAFGTGGEVEDGGNGAPCGASPCGSGGGGTRFSTACDGSPASGVTAMAVSGGGQVGGISRKYDDEKHRVPSWCDRVLWRSLPGRLPSSSGAAACDDPFFYASDHAPVSQRSSSWAPRPANRVSLSTTAQYTYRT